MTIARAQFWRPFLILMPIGLYASAMLYENNCLLPITGKTLVIFQKFWDNNNQIIEEVQKVRCDLFELFELFLKALISK
jgi:hypothetical protein